MRETGRWPFDVRPATIVNSISSVPDKGLGMDRHAESDGIHFDDRHGNRWVVSYETGKGVNSAVGNRSPSSGSELIETGRGSKGGKGLQFSPALREAVQLTIGSVLAATDPGGMQGLAIEALALQEQRNLQIIEAAERNIAPQLNEPVIETLVAARESAFAKN